ncbi:MAG: type II secretion system protein, partial [Bdellovibrionota bacterium]
PVSRVTNQRGVTLVELLISTSLFGFLMVAVSSIFATQATNSARSSNENEFNEQLSSFANTLESYLTNTTQLIDCSCQGATNCVVGNAGSCAQAGKEDYCQSSSYIEVETEGADDPSEAGGSGNCNQAGDRGATPEGMHSRGCKRIIRVTYDPPTKVSGADPSWTVGKPGKITIDDRTSGTPQIIQEFKGAYFFRCGQHPVDSSNLTTPSSDLFRLEIKAKTRHSNLTDFSTEAEADGWYPAVGSNAADPGFMTGTHRQFASDFTFRNWNVPGVHFGRTTTYPECIQFDDAVKNVGITSDRLCCSGYYDPGPNVCIAQSACAPRGTGGVPAAVCCSKMRKAGVCL